MKEMPRGASLLPGADLLMVIMGSFCQSKNSISRFKLSNGRLTASKRNTLNTF